MTHRINNLKEDKFHGAGWLTRYAIETLMLAAEQSQSYSMLDFINQIKDISSELIEVRPGMVSIANYVSLYMLQIQASARKYRNINPLQSEAAIRGREVLKRIERNTAQAAANCATIISNGDTIMTCSFSSLVCQSLAEARKQDSKFKVLICQSQVGSISYGKETSLSLIKNNISHKIIDDNEMRKCMRGASRVLIGADAVLSSGEIINGIPSLQLAASAAIMSTPVTVVCESAKFDAHALLGKGYTAEPGFDKIACGLWTQIITESSIISKDDLSKYMDKVRATF
ncbi:MAG TPA: hypothetical protein VJ488_04525 [Dehalococcoidia bacterium]|nr:hypothetical protein [Dehalococcoidia bacterium]